MSVGKPRRRKVVVIVLVAAACCVMACALAAVYQVGCSFKVGTPAAQVRAGERARLALWQSDCLLAVFGHACYETPEVTVKGLPPQCAVSAVEWVSCHASDLVIMCEPTTPVGVYPIKIRLRDSLSFWQRVGLEVTAR